MALLRKTTVKSGREGPKLESEVEGRVLVAS